LLKSRITFWLIRLLKNDRFAGCSKTARYKGTHRSRVMSNK